jgi:hypothetical protein
MKTKANPSQTGLPLAWEYETWEEEKRRPFHLFNVLKPPLKIQPEFHIKANRMISAMKNA